MFQNHKANGRRPSSSGVKSEEPLPDVPKTPTAQLSLDKKRQTEADVPHGPPPSLPRAVAPLSPQLDTPLNPTVSQAKKRSHTDSVKGQENNNLQNGQLTVDTNGHKSPNPVDSYTNNNRLMPAIVVVNGHHNNNSIGVNNNNNNSSNNNNKNDGGTGKQQEVKSELYSLPINSPGTDYWHARNPVADQVFITDVTVNLKTVTIRECKTEKGFFRERDPKSDVY